MKQPLIPPPGRRQQLNVRQLYLVAFNVISALGWGYILVLTLLHMFNLDGKAQPASSPSHLQPLYQRATTLFYRVGAQTALVQTIAVLEVFHVLFGWVKSPLQTTVMQVSSRLFLIWGITEQFPVVCSNPLYASMVLSWAMTEIIRYSFYACSLVGKSSFTLLYLRYTTFYILYLTGASSEAFLIYATLPAYSPFPGWPSWLQGMWKPTDYIRAGLFIIWWPGLYTMYTYMVSQRRKVLGLGTKKVIKTQ